MTKSVFKKQLAVLLALVLALGMFTATTSTALAEPSPDEPVGVEDELANVGDEQAQGVLEFDEPAEEITEEPDLLLAADELLPAADELLPAADELFAVHEMVQPLFGSAPLGIAMALGTAGIVPLDAPAPPIATTPQTFLVSGTLAELTISGTAIKWYADEALTMGPLALDTPLVNGTTYYATQTVDGEESLPAAVMVNLDPLFPPYTVSPQTFTSGSRVSDLVAYGHTGAVIKWYDSPTGGNLLNGNTTLVDGQSYYASQTYWGVESARCKVEVLIPYDYTYSITIADYDQPQSITVVEGAIFGELTVYAETPLGENLMFWWFSNTTNSTTGGTPLGSATSGDRLASYRYSNTLTVPTTLTASGSPYYFYCLVTAANAADVVSAVATVTVNPPFNPGAITPGSASVVSGSTNPITISNATFFSGGIAPFAYAWYKDGVLISGASSNSYTIPDTDKVNTSAAPVTITYTRGARNGTADFSLSQGAFTLTVYPVFTPGAISGGSQTIASGSTAPITVDSSTPAAGGDGNISYQWYKNSLEITGATSAAYTIPDTDKVNTSGAPVTITYTRSAKDTFAQPTLIASANSYILTVNDAPTYDLTVNAGTGGTVSGTPSGQYYAGSAISVLATADSGYKFVNWTVSGATITGGSTANPATFNMPANAVTLTANFALKIDASISPTSASFDKNAASAGYQDLAVTLSSGDYSLSTVECGGYTLQAGTDFAASSDTYTIKKEYLSTLNVGTQTITFVMSGGVNPVLTITVAATVAPVITSANSTSVVNGTGGTFQVTATGTTPITYSLDGAEPAGVSIDASGLITIAALTAVGTHTFTITAENGTSPDASQVFTLTVTAAPPIVYPVLKHFGTWAGSGTASGSVDADHGTFLRLTYNGNVVDPSSYTVTQGSTVITLHEAYLKTLANGTHTFRAEFTDGYADLTLTVNVQGNTNTNLNNQQTGITSNTNNPQAGSSNNTNNPQAGSSPNTKSNSPATGDSANMLGLGIALLSAALGLLLISIWRKRQHVRGRR